MISQHTILVPHTSSFVSSYNAFTTPKARFGRRFDESLLVELDLVACGPP